MFRKLTAVTTIGAVAFILAGCHESTSPTETAASAPPASVLTTPGPASPMAAPVASSGLPVFPTALEGHPSFELGQLIYLLMPSARTPVGWDWAVDSPIVWIDNGFVSTDVSTYRRGFARVNVMGNWSTELKRKKDELGWEVQLFTKAPAKFGPQEIIIQPGTDGGDDTCFGTLFDNCWFDPRPSLKAAGIEAKSVCQYGPNEANATYVYQLSAPGKAPVLFSWLQSKGSGGDSASVSLLLDADKKAACTPPNP
ncbi:hypothetical protein [Burkholderia anthina]|uniref:hypothetical protein n=1 Tax=Burkholderia anthina TaxID=179879 RepID=UPI00158E99E1|nr:hypothetical protein [Burkholderia anthina]